jgi:peptidoglycan hydrolase CwlO-like protein
MRTYIVLSFIVFALLITPLSSVAQEQPEDQSDQQSQETEQQSEEETNQEEQVSDEGGEQQFQPAQSEDDRQQQKRDLEEERADLEQKLDNLSQKKDTLSNQIQYMDTQVYLAELKAEETKEKIEQTEEEIDSLGTKIEGLDSSLDYLSRSLLRRVVDGYKNRNVSFFDLILNSDNAPDLMNRVKYYEAAQENNQKVLVQVQQTKSNFQEQKTVRERKKEELDQLTETLELQSQELQRQQDAKRTLLAATQNDEQVYRARIAEINRQIESFKNFVQTSGANSTVGANALGTGEGGWYLSQRDSRWASASMGDSSETVLDVGCFITSIAMVFQSKGYGYSPLNIANDASYFYGGPNSACFPTSTPTAYLCIPSTFNGSWPNGLSYKNISFDDIDSQLENGNPVIAGVNGGSHYVVLKKAQGDDYLINDPIYGPDQLLYDRYSLSGPLGVFE